ncbi:hypothetical protein Hanom_Chr13g01218971 [Helianthus anomalus]
MDMVSDGLKHDDYVNQLKSIFEIPEGKRNTDSPEEAIGTTFSERRENYTLFFLLNLDLQWRREKSGDVEMAGRERISFFQLPKVCLPYVPR